MHPLLKKKVIMTGISDVILKTRSWDDEYRNTKTKKTNRYYTNLLTDNNYLVFNNTSSNIIGIYAEYNEQYDAVIVLHLYFNTIFEKWMENGRIIFTRDKVHLKNTISFRDAIDVTGYYEREQMFPGKTMKIIRDYFNGCYVKKSVDFEDVGAFFYPDEINDIYSYNGEYTVKCFGVYNLNMDGFEVKNNSIPIVLKNRVGMAFKQEFKDGILHFYIYDGRTHIGYLQNTGNGYVFRCFICIPTNHIKKWDKKIDIQFIEYKRIGINDNLLDTHSLRVFDVPLVFYDKEGIENGMFRYLEPILKKMSNAAKRGCESVRIRCSMIYWFGSSMKFAYMFTISSLLEKISNSPYKNLKQRIFNELGESDSSVEDFFDRVLGTINMDKKALHQVIGMPVHMLKSLNSLERHSLRMLKNIKEIFKTAPEYLANMSSDSTDKLINLMLGEGLDSYNYLSAYIKNTSTLVEIFGPANHLNYIKYLTTHHELDKYTEYLNKLIVLKDITNDFNWKLKGEALSRANDALAPAYYAMLDGTTWSDYTEKFKKQEKEWRKLSYKKGQFIITYPKKPSDIVIEGVKLNHCVKTFLDKVAEGETTILFIRKMSSPEKPYYTLEIRDGVIRQCHGTNNSSTTKSLKNFIKKFCQIKGIKYSDGTDALDAD